MDGFKSCAVNASAGFGKTENLAVRLIGMMLAADNPEKQISAIVAMTFTRAAAMEIYERLILMLCSTRQDGCIELRRKLELENFDAATVNPEKVERLLKLLIICKNRLNISTIDSFMLNTVSSFPFELGFPGAPRIISGFEQNKIAALMVNRLLGAAADEAEELKEACRESLVESASGKQLFAVAQDLLGQAQVYYEWRNDAECWERFAGLQLDKRTAETDFSVWSEYQGSREFAKFQSKPRGIEFNMLMEKCRNINEYTGFSSQELATLREFFKYWDEFESGELKPDGFAFMDKFPTECRLAVKRLLKLAADLLISRSGRRTAAVRKLLQDYSGCYRKEVLARGMAGFSDLPRVLADNENDWVFDIHFRLNSRLRHWLIDEFQDTSIQQLTVFNSIIDELPGDDSRSLYIVGDVKQAIYGWRSGDYRLMAAEQKRYGLVNETLNCSYRYGTEICGGLNRIFSPEALEHSAIPGQTAADWNSAWTLHSPGRRRDGSVIPPPGCMEILQLQPESTMTFAQLINAKLSELKWEERSMRCAILVRDNKEGMELKEELATVNPELQNKLIWEGEESIASDYFIAALLEFMVHLQHPGDTLSLFAAEMHPDVAGVIPHCREEFEHEAKLLNNGIHNFLRHTLARIAERSPQRRCFSENIELLLTAAGDFDRTSGFKDAINFRSFIDDYKKSSTALAGKIKMMTVHHSKGLTFDAVFLPLKNSNSWNSVPTRGFMRSEEENFIIFNPGAEGLTNPSLNRLLQNNHGRRIFEELCVLYVGLTRARRAVFTLLPPPAKEKQKLYRGWNGGEGESIFIRDRSKLSYYPADFIFESCFKLNDVRVDDDTFPEEQVMTGRFGEAWYRNEPVVSRRIKPPAALPELKAGGRTTRMPRVRPAPMDENISSLMQLRDNGTGERILRMKRQFWNEMTSGKAGSDGWMAICMKNQFTASLLSFKGAKWLMKRFDTVIDNRAVSGCFELVNIIDGHGNAAAGAQQIMFDFTEEIAPDELRERYRELNDIYNQALAGLLKLEVTLITGIVVNPPSGAALVL